MMRAPYDPFAVPPSYRTKGASLGFRDVYDQTLPLAVRLARKLGVAEGDVDDVVQDLFIAVHRRLADFEGRSSIKTWVAGILMNLVHNYRRQRRRRSDAKPEGRWRLDAAPPATGSNDPWEGAALAEAQSLVRQALGDLTAEKASLFVKVEIEGLTVVQVARSMRANVDTVYARVRVARAAFRAALARRLGP